MATPSSVKGVLPRVLENLDSFKREDQIDTNGWATSLAEHTIVLSTNHEAHEGCRKLSEKFKNKCFEFEHGFNNGVQDHFTLNTQHAANIGLSRIKVLTDLVSLGYDIFYFDLHQYFFQHPLKYLYAHTKGSFVVSSTKCVAAQQNADGSLPDDHHHLDLIFLRSNPAAFRCGGGNVKHGMLRRAEGVLHCMSWGDTCSRVRTLMASTIPRRGQL